MTIGRTNERNGKRMRKEDGRERHRATKGVKEIKGGRGRITH
jgi:hypothetical protein